MAINFPSTAGQATDGTFTYVVAGITYSWNGESWTAAGSGATATDLTVFSVTNDAPAAGSVLSYNNTNGIFTYIPPDLSGYVTGSLNDLGGLTDVTLSSSSSGQTLKYNGSAWVNSTFSVNDLSDTDINSGGFSPLADGDLLQWSTSQSKWINNPIVREISTTRYAYFGVGDDGTGYVAGVQIEGNGPGGSLEISNGGYPVAISFNYNSGVAGQVITATGVDANTGQATGADWATPAGLQSRTTAQTTATSLSSNGSVNLSITTPKTYALLKIETSHAAWVTLYTDTTSRTNDANRAETTDPIPGSGVIAEVITSGAVTQLISPGTIAYNSAGSGTTYAKVVNKSGSTANVVVTLHYVQLEV